jgi:hypothetical protein
MLDARQAELDAKIFQLILNNVRSEMGEEDQPDKRIKTGDIDACLKAGSFMPVYDQNTDLITFFVELLELSAVYGSEDWCWVADQVGPDGPDYYDHDTIPPGVGEEITAGIARVLACGHQAVKLQKAATVRLVGLGEDPRPS